MWGMGESECVLMYYEIGVCLVKWLLGYSGVGDDYYFNFIVCICDLILVFEKCLEYVRCCFYGNNWEMVWCGSCLGDINEIFLFF